MVRVLDLTEAERRLLEHGGDDRIEPLLGIGLRWRASLALKGRIPFTVVVGARLHAAASSGRVDELRALLDAGANIDARDENRATALHLAAFHNQGDALNLLIARGADVNAANSRAYSPLHAAAREGHVAVIGRLLDAGASVDPPDADGFTPLMFAAAYTDAVEAIRLLILRGAAVLRASRSGTTPLIWAAGAGRTNNVTLLLEHGADPTARDARGRTALDIARERKRAAVVDVLSRALNEGP